MVFIQCLREVNVTGRQLSYHMMSQINRYNCVSALGLLEKKIKTVYIYVHLLRIFPAGSTLLKLAEHHIPFYIQELSEYQNTFKLISGV